VTGLPDWLASRADSSMAKVPVTKAEIMAFLDAGGIQVEEVIKSDSDEMMESSAFYDREWELQQEGWNQEWDDDIEEIPADGEDVDTETEDLFDPDHVREPNRVQFRAAFDVPHFWRNDEAVKEVAPEATGSGAAYSLGHFDTEAEARAALDQVKSDLFDAAVQNDWGDEYRNQAREEMGPKWRSFVTEPDKGEDYTELLLTLPPGVRGNPPKAAKNNHWAEQDVIAHIRFDTREDADGNKVMMIHEFQSDWHQDGAKRGYDVQLSDAERDRLYNEIEDAKEERDALEATPEYVAWVAERDRLRKVRDDLNQEAQWAIQELDDLKTGWPARAMRSPGQFGGYEELKVKMLADLPAGVDPENFARIYDKTAEVLQREGDAFEAVNKYVASPHAGRLADLADTLNSLRTKLSNNSGVPDAPFKGMGYASLAMKRAIQWAVENQFDKVAWIRGNQQNGANDAEGGWFYDRNLINITNDLLKKIAGKGVSPEEIEAAKIDKEARLKALNAEYDELDAQIRAIYQEHRLNNGVRGNLYVSTPQGEQPAPEGVEEQVKELRMRREDLHRLRYQIRREPARGTHRVEKIYGIDGMNSEPESYDSDEFTDEEREEWDAAQEREGEWRQQRNELSHNADREDRVLTAEEQAESDRLYDLLRDSLLQRGIIQERALARRGHMGFSITPEITAAVENGLPLFQKNKDRIPRGRIDFNRPDRIVIELFSKRNLSTFSHELGHLMAETMQRFATSPDAPERAVKMWHDLQDWWQENGYAVRDDDFIPEGAHELFADTYLVYLQEGKAPSLSLQRVFETISSWLRQIYKGVLKLNMPISPEIRSVFDRMLATDEELFQAREAQGLSLMFDEAAQAALGISKSEMAAYQTMIGDARSEARAKLTDKVMASVRASKTKSYRAERQRVRAEIEKVVDANPVIRALRNLETMPIPADWYEERYGAEGVDKLPRRVPPIIRKSAADPEIVAEMSGFPGADAMVKALMAAKVEQDAARAGGDQRGMRERLIETATDVEMNERYGDPLTDGSIEREALAAVHNDMQGEVIATELRVLGRNLNRRPTPYRLAREWARGRIRGSEVREHLTGSAIQRYVRAAAKAGNAAEDALAKQDFEEAFKQKQFQLLNNALVAEARQARDEVEKATKRLRRIAEARTIKSVDQSYLEQAQALLEQVDLKQRTAKSVERFGKWEAWARAREAEGYDIVVPHSFEAMIGKTNWTKLPVSDLLALADTVKQIEHLGRLKKGLSDNRDQRDFETVVAEAVTSAGEAGNIPPKGTFTDPSWWDSIKHRVASMDAALLKLEAVFDWLDNGNPNGVFNRYVFRPIARAQAREDDMLRDYYGRIKDAFEAVGAKTLRRWSEKVTTDLIDRETGLPAVFTRQRLVAMALNVGNEGNMQRLVDGYGWNEGAVMRLLDAELTKQEWQFVQQVWDTIDTLWPEIERMERAINGVAPDKIEAREIVTSHGTFRGGYYPAVYDSTLSLRAEEQQGQRTDLFEALYTRATTRASATKERSEKVKRPLLLDLGVINRHLGEVIHDITHREAVMQAHRFLTNEKVADAVNRSLGQEIRGQFRPWLQYVANSWAMERSGNEGLGRFMGALRANTTVVGMGFRLTTIITQAAGYANSFEYVGTKWVTPAIARFAAHPIATFDFVMERSDEVRNRMNNLDRDIRLTINQIAGKSGYVSAAKRFAFHGIGLMDRAVVIPTWLGAYNKALETGASEEDAAYAGDKAVRLSQGAGSPKDLAAVQRGTGKWGEALKLMTMFYSYMSAYYQRQRAFGRDVKRASAADIPSLVARAWWLFVVAPILPDLLKSLVGGGDLPDEEEGEGWGMWIFKKILGNSLGAIPFVRDLYQPVWASLAGERAFDYQFTPAQGAGASVVNVAKDIGRVADGKETKKATKHSIETVGYFTGLVPGQVASSVQFLVDVGYGEAEPEGFGEWVEGLVTGRIKEDQ
jgi:hypothetical protein